jgi:hypothetical protein
MLAGFVSEFDKHMYPFWMNRVDFYENFRFAQNFDCFESVNFSGQLHV